MRTHPAKCTALGILACLALLGPTTGFAEISDEDHAFEEAILKIEVEFLNSKREPDGTELCKSEGTGFIVNSKHVVTALHVYDFNEKCGPTKYILGWLWPNIGPFPLRAVDSDEDADLALLASEEPMTSSYAEIATTLQYSPCAVWPGDDGSYFGKSATRYGVPAGKKNAALVAVDIGRRDGEFQPDIEITPIEVTKGESGGPIIKDYIVVGMIKRKATEAGMIGVMVRAKEVLRLLHKNSVSPPGGADTCNPHLWVRRDKQKTIKEMVASVRQTDERTVSGEVVFSNYETLDANTQKLIVETARKSVEGSLNRNVREAGIRVTTRLAGAGKIAFEIVSDAPIPQFPSSPGSMNSFDSYTRKLADLLEIDAKVMLNAAFEQRILELPRQKFLNDLTTQQSGSQLFNPNLKLDKNTELPSQESLLPNRLEPLWNRRLEELDIDSKVHLNQQLRMKQLKPPAPLR